MKTVFFTLPELCVSDTGLANIPGWEQVDGLYRLVTHVLDPLRAIYRKPIRVNSGFRCAAVNKAVGGAPTSQHLQGLAVDISGGDGEQNKRLFEIIAAQLPFDQLIDEKNYAWVHVSLALSANRKQVLHL